MWVYLINQRSSCNISYSIQQIPIFCFLYETSRGLLVTELLSAEIFYFDLIVRETRGTWLGLTLAANALDYNRYYYHHQILEISLFCHTMGIFHPLRVYSNEEMRGERREEHLPPLILPPGCSNTFWPLDFQTICEDNFRNGMKMRPGIVTLYTLNYKSRQR